MGVAPLDAYFSDDCNLVVEQATLSAEGTHAHPEGIAEAIAAAVGTAWAGYSYTLRDSATEWT